MPSSSRAFCACMRLITHDYHTRSEQQATTPTTTVAASVQAPPLAPRRRLLMKSFSLQSPPNTTSSCHGSVRVCVLEFLVSEILVNTRGLIDSFSARNVDRYAMESTLCKGVYILVTNRAYVHTYIPTDLARTSPTAGRYAQRPVQHTPPAVPHRAVHLRASLQHSSGGEHAVDSTLCSDPLLTGQLTWRGIAELCDTWVFAVV